MNIITTVVGSYPTHTHKAQTFNEKIGGGTVYDRLRRR